MNSTRTTALFAAAFATLASIEILESGRPHPALWAGLAILLLVLVASTAFWLASRGSTYRWYSGPIAGIATFFSVTTLHHWLFPHGRITALALAFGALTLVPVLLARLVAEQKIRGDAQHLP